MFKAKDMMKSEGWKQLNRVWMFREINEKVITIQMMPDMVQGFPR